MVVATTFLFLKRRAEYREQCKYREHRNTGGKFFLKRVIKRDEWELDLAVHKGEKILSRRFAIEIFSFALSKQVILIYVLRITCCKNIIVILRNVTT